MKHIYTSPRAHANQLLILLLLLPAVGFGAAVKKEPKEKEYKCKIVKFRNELMTRCNDKSQDRRLPPEPTPVQPAVAANLHIKDSSGAEYTYILSIGAPIGASHNLLNTKNGHVLGYDASGNISTLTKTLYETTDCNGIAYAAISSAVLKNRVFANVNAHRKLSSALILHGFAPGYVTLRSQFTNGVCSALNATINNLSIVDPTDFDATDLQTLSLPLELIN